MAPSKNQDKKDQTEKTPEEVIAEQLRNPGTAKPVLIALQGGRSGLGCTTDAVYDEPDKNKN